MGIDAQYQAIPYEPLLDWAMLDAEVAEALQSFDYLVTKDVANSPWSDDPVWLELSPVARQIVAERPGILDRTFSTRAWDVVYWLLAPNRRAMQDPDPAGMAEVAVFGAESLPRCAAAYQGDQIRFVRPATARTLGEFIDCMVDQARDMFDAAAMEDAYVYKSPQDRDDVIDVLTHTPGCTALLPARTNASLSLTTDCDVVVVRVDWLVVLGLWEQFARARWRGRHRRSRSRLRRDAPAGQS